MGTSDDDLPPRLFDILRQDFAGFRGEVNGRFDSLARDMVTTVLFTAYQEAQKATDGRQDARIKKLEDAEDTRDAAFRQLVEEQKRSRARFLTSIALSALTAVFGIIGGVVLWQITQALAVR